MAAFRIYVKGTSALPCACLPASGFQINSNQFYFSIAPKQYNRLKALYRAQGLNPPWSQHKGDRGKEKLLNGKKP